MHGIANDLSGLDIKILYYIRPYRDWIVSSYNFDVRIGLNKKPFDEYLRGLRPEISAWPVIEIWGEAVGWHNMRIRSIDPRDLSDGSLAADAFAALDIPPPAHEPVDGHDPDRENVSAHWYATELFRMIGAESSGRRWTSEDLATAEALHAYIDEATALLKIERPSASYLSAPESALLQRLYNDDLDRIFAKTGTRLQPDTIAMPKPGVVPSTAAIPNELLRLVRSIALDDERARRHPEAAKFVATAAFTALCKS